MTTPGRSCQNCEWFTREKRPGDSILAQKAPYCAQLGFFLFHINHAQDCRAYATRPGTTPKGR